MVNLHAYTFEGILKKKKILVHLNIFLSKKSLQVFMSSNI